MADRDVGRLSASATPPQRLPASLQGRTEQHQHPAALPGAALLPPPASCGIQLWDPAAGSAPPSAPAPAEQQRPPVPKPPPFLHPGTRTPRPAAPHPPPPHPPARSPGVQHGVPAANLTKAARGKEKKKGFFFFSPEKWSLFGFPRHWVAVTCRTSLRLVALSAQGTCDGALAYGPRQWAGGRSAWR